jgi:hypothetical protein
LLAAGDGVAGVGWAVGGAPANEHAQSKTATATRRTPAGAAPLADCLTFILLAQHVGALIVSLSSCELTHGSMTLTRTTAEDEFSSPS